MIGLEVTRVNDVRVAQPHGDIDAANATRLSDELADCIRDGADSLVIDLTDTAYLDSAGIDMLFRLAARLGERRCQLLVVIPPSSQLTRLAEIVSLPKAMPIHDTVEDALLACGHEPHA
jgi:anti-anti-sigma factor